MFDDALEDIRRTYDRVAERYAETHGEALAEKVLDRALLTAFAELAGAQAAAEAPLVADLGCGPGYEARHLAERGLRVLGIDLAPGMVAEATRRHAGVPGLAFREGSLLALPVDDATLAGAIAIYSVIHLPPATRRLAYAEMARVVRPGGPLLVSFHVSADSQAPGSSRRMTEWWGEAVRLDGYFLSPAEVEDGLVEVGFDRLARLERGPVTSQEFASERCYLLLRRR